MKIAPQARIAIVNFNADSERRTDYIMAELAAAFNSAGFETVARSSIEYVRRELNYPSSVKSGNQIEHFVGLEVGAQYILTGHLTQTGNRLRLNLDVVDLENPKNETVVRYNFLKNDEWDARFRDLEAGELVSPFADYGISEESSPLTSGGLLDMGMFFAEREEWDLAVEWYTGALNINPAYALAYFWRGHAWERRGNEGQAAEDYRRAAGLSPDKFAAHLRLGGILAARGDFDEAIAGYTEAIRLDPRNAEVYNVRGEIHSQQDDFDKALADFTQAIRIDPQNAAAYTNRGDIHAFSGEYDKAITDYTQAIKVNSGYVTAYRSRGKAYSDSGEPVKAIADYTQAIILDPNDAAAYNLRGILYINRFDYATAIADFTEANRLDPENLLYSRNLQAARTRQERNSR
ncbi:MAG: tetratricopeptide repeat protein [Treponema sp.]|nr:tetratricopeptide repeat protein [Treponema sp.]